MKVKYKRVDSSVHGEVKEIKLIGEDQEHEEEKHYFVFWHNQYKKNSQIKSKLI